MRKHIELKRFDQGTALTAGKLALPPLVIEGLEEFKGSFDRLCLHVGTAAIEAMLAADAEQLCGNRYQRRPLSGVGAALTCFDSTKQHFMVKVINPRSLRMFCRPRRTATIPKSAPVLATPA
jgi:hypothetical protein